MSDVHNITYEMTLSDIVRVLRKKWWVIAVISIISIASTAFVTIKLIDPIYRAETTLFVGKENNRLASLDLGEFSLNQKLVIDYREIILSELVANEVIKKLNINMSTAAFKGKINVTPIKDSRVFKISFESTDPKLSMEAANALASAIIDKAAEIIEVENVKLIDVAKLPKNSIKPDIKQNLAVAMILGLMTGICLIILIELLDNTIKSKSDIERYFSLNTIGEIPIFESENKKQRNLKGRVKWIQGDKDTVKQKVNQYLITIFAPRAPASEAYRALRTNIGYTCIDTGLKTLLITSTIPLEGKTTTASNIAITFAQAGKKVLLIDADLRKPKLHMYFYLINDFGITDIIAKDMEIEKTIKTIPEIDNLSIICSGAIPPNPTELLESNKMTRLIERVKEEYDMVIIDTPPVAHLTDAAILGKITDGVILVTAFGETKINMALHAKFALDNVHAKILGVVLTKIKIESGSEYYFKYNYNKSYYY